jgi:TolB-like protein
VLPFSVEAEEDKYLGDGITEEIITGLSMNRSLIVIARDSASRYRGAGASTTAAAELGVRYIVSGSVGRVPAGFKINVELIDTGVKPYPVIWRPPRPFTFEGADKELFTLQSKIAARIAAEIDPSIREAEIQRSRGSSAVGAYDYVLRGISMQFEEVENFKRAGDYFRQAIDIDPNYAQAHAHLARWHSLCVGEGRSESTDEDRRMAGYYADRAVMLDSRDAWVLATAGHIKSFLYKDFDRALGMFDQALQLNPISVTALFRSGTTLAYIGRGDEALERVHNAMQLSPFDYQTTKSCG